MSNYGLHEVHTGDNPTVDIVFIHGLRGDAMQTWTKGNTLWPRDLLAKDIPNSRILLYGYDSGVVHWDQSNVTQTDLRSDAMDLCAKLAAKRATADELSRPIILLGHSLGGLVASHALVLGERLPDGDAAKEIAKNLRGMVFFGTPFRGSPTAQPAEIARKILKVFGMNTQDSTLKLLGVDSEKLVSLNYEFPEVLRKRQSSGRPKDKIEAFFFYERLRTQGLWVVEDYSAQLPGCGECAPINANHIDLCKFGSPTDEGYDVLLRALRPMILPRKENSETRNDRTIINSGNFKAMNFTQGDMTISGGQRIDHF